MPKTATKAAPAIDEALEAKRAIKAAQDYFQTLFGNMAFSNVTPEEVELTPDHKYWLVTLSFEEPRRNRPDLPEFLRVPRQKFKVFKVERERARVVSMKMRNGG